VRVWSGGSKRSAVLPQSFQVFGKSAKSFGYSLVIFAGLLYTALLNEVLESLVGSQSKHLLAAACGIPGAKTLMNDNKKGFEFVSPGIQEDLDKLLSNIVGTAA
jgi:hypothetical protein